MREIEAAHITNRAEADEMLKKYEPVSGGEREDEADCPPGGRLEEAATARGQGIGERGLGPR